MESFFLFKGSCVVDIRYKVKKKLLGRNTHKYLLRLETPKTCGKKINFNLENILIKKKKFWVKNYVMVNINQFYKLALYLNQF